MRKLILFTAIAVFTIAMFGGCKTSAPQTKVVEATVSGRVHVLLAEGADPEQLVKAFADYELENKGRASRSQNKYAFTYNAARVIPAVLQEEVEKQKGVLQVEVMKK